MPDFMAIATGSAYWIDGSRAMAPDARPNAANHSAKRLPTARTPVPPRLDGDVLFPWRVTKITASESALYL
jgi:hypothetical protein